MSQTSILYLIRHASVILIVGLRLQRRTCMSTSEHSVCWKKNSGAQRDRTRNPSINRSNQSPYALPTELFRQMRIVGFNSYLIRCLNLNHYVAAWLHHTCIILFLLKQKRSGLVNWENYMLTSTSTHSYILFLIN